MWGGKTITQTQDSSIIALNTQCRKSGRRVKEVGFVERSPGKLKVQQNPSEYTVQGIRTHSKSVRLRGAQRPTSTSKNPTYSRRKAKVGKGLRRSPWEYVMADY